MKFEELKVGKKYYIVERTLNGVNMKEYTVKTIFNSAKAVLMVDKWKSETKLYLNTISNLLNFDDAINQYQEMKNQGAIKKPTAPTGVYTRCWDCGTTIDRRTAKRCRICGWHICPKCGACNCKSK